VPANKRRPCAQLGWNEFAHGYDYRKVPRHVTGDVHEQKHFSLEHKNVGCEFINNGGILVAAQLN
jgi:hypothetical protein